MWQRKGRSPEALRPRPYCRPLLGKRIELLFWWIPKETTQRAPKTAWNDVIFSSELLLILDVWLNVSKVNPTYCFSPHHIQSAHFAGIEVNAPGKRSPSWITETDHEFSREILNWQSLFLIPSIPSLSALVFSCIFNLTAAAYWRWQALNWLVCLRIRSFITKRLFCKLVACVAKGRKTTKNTEHWEAEAVGVQEGVSLEVISRVSVIIMVNRRRRRIVEQLSSTGLLANLEDGSFKV